MDSRSPYIQHMNEYRRTSLNYQEAIRQYNDCKYLVALLERKIADASMRQDDEAKELLERALRDASQRMSRYWKFIGTLRDRLVKIDEDMTILLKTSFKDSIESAGGHE